MTAMLQPNWEAERPSIQQIQRMWNQIQFRAEPFDPAPFAPVLDEIRRSHTFGGVILLRFGISEHPVFDWFASRNRLDEMEFFPKFLGSEVVRGAARDLQIPDSLGELAFEWASPFSFDGHIAQVLFLGGAYEKLKGTAGEAKRLALEFASAFFEERFDEVLLFRSFQAWTPWFHTIAWDTSWVIVDKRWRRVWLLCRTDED